MWSLKNLAIPLKLRLVILCATTAALAVTCVALFTFERIAFQSSLEQNLSTLAQVIGDNCAASLNFRQPEEAKRLLSALEAEPQIEAVGIYDDLGEIFESYERSGTAWRAPAFRPEAGFHWEEDHVMFVGELFYKKAGQNVGTICLQANFSAMRKRFRLYARVIGGVLLVSFFVAYLLSGPLQRIVSKPILNLAQTARAISLHRDYSVRAQKLGNDEIGTFTDAFNTMLTQIEQQNQALQSAKDGLEERVTDRTRELQELQRQNELILNSAGEGIYGLDLTGCITFINPIAAQMIGSTVERLVGQGEHSMVRHSNSEGHPYPLEDCPVCAGFKSGQPYSSADEVLWRMSGTPLNVTYIRTPLKADGRLVGAVVVFRDISEQKDAERRLATLNKQLNDTSRRAGREEVATAVLHNLGNVLNSVNVSTTLLSDQVRNLRTASLTKAAELLRENGSDLGSFLSQDPRGKMLPQFLEELAMYWTLKKNELARDLKLLAKRVDHIKDIVTAQQTYAKVSGLVEAMPLASLVEDALQVSQRTFSQHDVVLVREYAEVPPVQIDKHKALQILVNLIQNAHDALQSSPRPDRRLTLRIDRNGNDRVRIEVADNGMGIAPENLNSIFSHGFTTKTDGHGFGLHSGALAAKEMGGSLTVSSDGPGKGAAFVLDLPLSKVNAHA